MKRQHTKSVNNLLKDMATPPDIKKFVPTEAHATLDALTEDLINKDETDLLVNIQKYIPNWSPAPLLETLRQNFWAEYEISFRYNIPLAWDKVYQGVCERGLFYSLIQDQIKLAWLICRPLEYMQTVNAMLTHSYRQLQEILKLPLRNKDGSVNEKLVESQIKIAAMLDLRAKGGYLQRSEQLIRQQVQHFKGEDPTAVQAEFLTLDAKIKLLESKLQEKALPAPLIASDAELVGLPKK